MSLVNLPELNLVSADTTQTTDDLIAMFEALDGKPLYPGDPRRLFFNTIASLLVQQRALINKVSKMNYLRYASGSVLDEMGAFTETDRLPASKAKTTIRFQLSALQLSAIIIPAGTRVSTEGNPKVYFATIETVEIPSGSLTIDIASSCVVPGIAGNGYLSGQVKQIVDPIPFVVSAVNITTSAGGADIEENEPYRNRIREAPESFSVAGSEGAYRYWAKTASPSIIDVSVTSPSDAVVLIVPLLEGGILPNQDMLTAVSNACSSKKVRPLTDHVTVAAPTISTYDITLSYWVSRERVAEITAIQSAVSAAVTDYVLWQKSKLGRDVNPSELIRRAMIAGAHRVELGSPAFTAVTETQIAVADNVYITYGGLADD